MLNRLQLFRNIGQFDSVAAGAALALARLTLGYAENGRGKTTLAAVFRSLASGDALPITERHRLGAAAPPHIVIDCTGGPPAAVFQNGAWSRTVPDIAIFDDAFVDQNICSGLVIESDHRQKLHELILGAQGVALNRALQDAVAEIEEHNRTLRDLSEAIPADMRFGVAVDDFCALDADAAIDVAIREAERAVAAANEQDAIQATRSFEPFALPPIDVPGLEALLGQGLAGLDRAASERVQQHIATLGGGGEAWVADGMHRLPAGAGQAGTPCPFCAQDLAGSNLIAHYRSYFGEAYAGLKHDIADAHQAFQQQHGGDSLAAFERLVRGLSERRLFWARFTDIPELGLNTAAMAELWAAARGAVSAALESKRNAPLDEAVLGVEARRALDAYGRLVADVAALNDRLQQSNEAIAVVKERAAGANLAALRADLARCNAVRSRYAPAVAALCDDYLAEKAEKAAAEGRRDAARTALDQYRREIFPAYQTSINDYLRRFNAGFRLDRVTSQNTRGGSACIYNVLINNTPIAVNAAAAAGAPSFRNTLSAGDRNTLALAIFFASLEQRANLANTVVVIDDPISSLDDHRSLTTVQEVRRLMERTAQVVVLSHSKPFLCTLWDGADTTLRAAFQFTRLGDGSNLQAWDVNSDLITEHDRRHALIREFIDGAGANTREVAQSLRPVLEAFMRVSFPADCPPATLLGPFRGICEQRVGTPRQILNQPDIDELRNLTEFANRYHHDTNPAYLTQRINDAELLDFARRTLAFAKRQS